LGEVKRRTENLIELLKNERGSPKRGGTFDGRGVSLQKGRGGKSLMEGWRATST